MTERTSDQAKWYALRSKPHKDRLLWQQVRLREYEVYYPQIRVKPVNPRSRKVRPYFPGYMFVRADLDRIGASTFNYMPYSLGLVSFGGRAASIRDDIIQALKRRIADAIEARRDHVSQFQPGDKVIITDGPLAGYEGIFDQRLTGQERVRVLLNMLGGRQLPTQLDGRTIEPASRSQDR